MFTLKLEVKTGPAALWRPPVPSQKSPGVEVKTGLSRRMGRSACLHECVHMCVCVCCQVIAPSRPLSTSGGLHVCVVSLQPAAGRHRGATVRDDITAALSAGRPRRRAVGSRHFVSLRKRTICDSTFLSEVSVEASSTSAALSPPFCLSLTFVLLVILSWRKFRRKHRTVGGPVCKTKQAKGHALTLLRQKNSLLRASRRQSK